MKIIKRIFDLVIAGLTLVFAMPIMLLLAIAIKLDSAGPVLYYRLPDGSFTYRVGTGGKPFKYFKFRSMTHGNNGTPQEVTRVGHLIRCWHLDELPELFLVLSGKMSLVGPRPLSVNIVDRLTREYFQAKMVKPGITGPSQLKGKFLPIPKKIETDLWYIENWSIFQDVRILLRTPIVIFNQRNQPQF